MRTIIPFLLLGCLGLAARAEAADQDAAVVPKAYATLANELTAEQMSRTERIDAVYAFVRDTIAEVPTRWQ